TELSIMVHSRAKLLALLSLGLVISTAARGDDPAAEAVFKKLGLRRSGSTYILAEEAEFQKKLTAAKGLSKQMAFALAQQRGIEQGANESKQMLLELKQKRILLNRQLSQVTKVFQNHQLVGALNEVEGQIELLEDSAS